MAGNRHKGYHLPKEGPHDVRAMFVATAYQIAQGAAMLDAYRLGTGVLICPARSPEAQRSLQEAADACLRQCGTYVRSDWARAMEHAGKHARLAYVGQWWTRQLLPAPPVRLAEGDRYFSRHDIAKIVERRMPLPKHSSEEARG